MPIIEFRSGRIKQAGEMDRQITIQEATQSQGEVYGEPLETWTDLTTIWAAVLDKAGREFYNAKQIVAEITEIFHIRYMSGLDTTMRIYYDGRYYNIARIEEIGRDERINLWAVAKRS